MHVGRIKIIHGRAVNFTVLRAKAELARIREDLLKARTDEPHLESGARQIAESAPPEVTGSPTRASLTHADLPAGSEVCLANKGDKVRFNGATVEHNGAEADGSIWPKFVNSGAVDDAGWGFATSIAPGERRGTRIGVQAGSEDIWVSNEGGVLRVQREQKIVSGPDNEGAQPTEVAQTVDTEQASTYKRGRFVDVVTGAKQVIAIPDVHGDFLALREHLLRAGVISDTRPDLAADDYDSVPAYERYELSRSLRAGTQIVFLGDYLDRGPDSMEVISLVRKLATDAVTTNGTVRVHTLRGNHEAIFLRFFELFKGKTQAEVEEMFSGSVSFIAPIDFGGSLGNKSLAELRCIINGPEYRATYDSIIRRYGTWENAVRKMETDGTLAFLRQTRAVVIIDNLEFTHAGPVMSDALVQASSRADAVEALDQHFERLFSDVFANHWADATGILGPAQEEQKAWQNGDHSSRYIGKVNNIRSSPRAATTYLKAWDKDPKLKEHMQILGLDHIYVGHHSSDEVERYGEHATCLDAGMSRAYKGKGGILIIDPENAQPARVLRVYDDMQHLLPPGVVSVDDLTEGRELAKILDNEYTRGLVAAEEARREAEKHVVRLPEQIVQLLELSRDTSKTDDQRKIAMIEAVKQIEAGCADVPDRLFDIVRPDSRYTQSSKDVAWGRFKLSCETNGRVDLLGQIAKDRVSRWTEQQRLGAGRAEIAIAKKRLDHAKLDVIAKDTAYEIVSKDQKFNPLILRDEASEEEANAIIMLSSGNQESTTQLVQQLMPLVVDANPMDSTVGHHTEKGRVKNGKTLVAILERQGTEALEAFLTHQDVLEETRVDALKAHVDLLIADKSAASIHKLESYARSSIPTPLRNRAGREVVVRHKTSFNADALEALFKDTTFASPSVRESAHDAAIAIRKKTPPDGGGGGAAPRSGGPVTERGPGTPTLGSQSPAPGSQQPASGPTGRAATGTQYPATGTLAPDIWSPVPSPASRDSDSRHSLGVSGSPRSIPESVLLPLDPMGTRVEVIPGGVLGVEPLWVQYSPVNSDMRFIVYENPSNSSPLRIPFSATSAQSVRRPFEFNASDGSCVAFDITIPQQRGIEEVNAEITNIKVTRAPRQEPDDSRAEVTRLDGGMGPLSEPSPEVGAPRIPDRLYTDSLRGNVSQADPRAAATKPTTNAATTKQPTAQHAADRVGGKTQLGIPYMSPETVALEQTRLDSILFDAITRSNPGPYIAKALQDGADIEATRTHDANNPLRLAAEEGNVEAITELLNRGADIEADDTYGNTPLLRASLAQKPAAVRLFIEAGANVNAINDGGNTALGLFAHFRGNPGNDDIVRLLIAHGADVEQAVTWLAADRQAVDYLRSLSPSVMRVSRKSIILVDSGTVPLPPIPPAMIARQKVVRIAGSNTPPVVLQPAATGSAMSPTQLAAQVPVFSGTHVDEFRGATNVIAVGDIHGDFEAMVRHLIAVGVIVDTEPRLAYTNFRVLPERRYTLNANLQEGTHVVFTGDYVDRGPNSIQVVSLVRALEASSATLKGKVSVHALRGNHEAIIGKVLERMEKVTDTQFAEMERNPAKLAEHLNNHPDRFFLHQPDIYVLTLSSMKERYGGWQKAVAGMKADGTLDFIYGRKSVVLIDNLLFTHGGPVMSPSVLNAQSRDEALMAMERHYSAIAADPNKQHWHTFFDNPQLRKAGDCSNSYVMDWANDARIPAFLNVMGADHIYVGHQHGSNVRTEGHGNITCLDGELGYNCEFSEGGVVVIRPEGVKVVMVTTPGRTDLSAPRFLANGQTREATLATGALKPMMPPPAPSGPAPSTGGSSFQSPVASLQTPVSGSEQPVSGPASRVSGSESWGFVPGVSDSGAGRAGSTENTVVMSIPKAAPTRRVDPRAPLSEAPMTDSEAVTVVRIASLNTKQKKAIGKALEDLSKKILAAKTPTDPKIIGVAVELRAAVQKVCDSVVPRPTYAQVVLGALMSDDAAVQQRVIADAKILRTQYKKVLVASGISGKPLPKAFELLRALRHERGSNLDADSAALAVACTRNPANILNELGANGKLLLAYAMEPNGFMSADDCKPDVVERFMDMTPAERYLRLANSFAATIMRGRTMPDMDVFCSVCASCAVPDDPTVLAQDERQRLLSRADLFTRAQQDMANDAFINRLGRSQELSMEEYRGSFQAWRSGYLPSDPLQLASSPAYKQELMYKYEQRPDGYYVLNPQIRSVVESMGRGDVLGNFLRMAREECEFRTLLYLRGCRLPATLEFLPKPISTPKSETERFVHLAAESHIELSAHLSAEGYANQKDAKEALEVAQSILLIAGKMGWVDSPESIYRFLELLDLALTAKNMQNDTGSLPAVSIGLIFRTGASCISLASGDCHAVVSAPGAFVVGATSGIPSGIHSSSYGQMSGLGRIPVVVGDMVANIPAGAFLCLGKGDVSLDSGRGHNDVVFRYVNDGSTIQVTR